jgi:hypothetical protein
MIQGRFGNSTGRPYIEGRVVFPRLGVAGNISFLADTGADRTTIMQMDGARLGVDYSRLANSSQAVGTGGISQLFRENAVLAFLDQGVRLCIYDLEILIQQPMPALATVPSLLGRDVIQNWIFVCDKPHKLLTADVVSVSYDFMLPPHVAALPPAPGVAPPPVLP